jgi:hypothetical protein
LKESVEDVRKKIDAFVREDATNAAGEKYSLRDR